MDGTKLLTELMQDKVAPGEEVLGACKATGKGGIGKNIAGGVASGAVGGAVGGAIGGALSASKQADGLGAAVPQDKVFWVGVTNQRLVYFGVGVFSSKPKTFQGETPLDAVASVAIARKMATRRVTFEFTDGSAATVDLYRASSPDSLQSGLEQALPGRVVEGG